MYFLGILEKILKGTPKLEEKVIVKNKESSLIPNVKLAYKKIYDKPYVKGEYKKYDKPYIKNNNLYKQALNTEKKQSNNCFGVFVKDGDTFDAMYNQKRVCFRLAGIDSPEINQPFSKGVTEFLKSKVLRKVVYLEFKGQDIYNREIVEVYEDKEMKISINKQILEEGYATSERYRNDKGELTHNVIEHLGNKIAEIGANFADKGMWADPPVTKIEQIKVVPDTAYPISTPDNNVVRRKFPK